MLTGDMLRRSAERFPSKPAILWNGTSLSYLELDAAANRLANALIGAGISKGTKVAIISTNRTEYGIAFFGVARSGAVKAGVPTKPPGSVSASLVARSTITGDSCSGGCGSPSIAASPQSTT